MNTSTRNVKINAIYSNDDGDETKFPGAATETLDQKGAPSDKDNLARSFIRASWSKPLAGKLIAIEVLDADESMIRFYDIVSALGTYILVDDAKPLVIEWGSTVQVVYTPTATALAIRS